MKEPQRLSDKVLYCTQQNPFSDSQARNFSDAKILNEFWPVSNYWSLFNDQHEILLGTRGSGKTFLLKMMRYSMLKRIQNPHAQNLANQKTYIALYVPMYLEFVTHLTGSDITADKQIQLFQFAFNCLLAQSLLIEVAEILSEEKDELQCAKTNIALAHDINSIWFNDNDSNVTDIFSLSQKIKKLFYNFDVCNDDTHNLPPVFKRPIGATLLSVKELIANHLRLPKESTWIICVDEAEFLTEPMQRCINNVFRSDSTRVVLKVATLPYYHCTLQTLNANVFVSAGNDFNYRVVDMKYDSQDFLNLTNSLIKYRLKTRMTPEIEVNNLEEFLGTYGKDDQIDYYRREVGSDATYDGIMEAILSDFSKDRKSNISDYTNPRKEIYDKFAPIFYIRHMYALSRKGNTIPGWYAGSQMVRKIAQGNPRAFIQIMSSMFELARKSKLTPKAQHGVLRAYSHYFCQSTQALEIHGPTIYRELDLIGQELHKDAHDGYLKAAGSNFSLKFDNDASYTYAQKWLRQAIAYSRIFVDEDTLKNGLAHTTTYMFSNAYAVEYWLPMRTVNPKRTFHITQKFDTYTVKLPTPIKSPQNKQLSMFEEESE